MLVDVPAGAAVGGADFEHLSGKKLEVFPALAELAALFGFPGGKCPWIGMSKLLLESGQIGFDLWPVAGFENRAGHHDGTRILAAVAIQTDVANRVEVGEALVVVFLRERVVFVAV